MVLLTWGVAVCFVPAGGKPGRTVPGPETVVTLPVEMATLRPGGYNFAQQRYLPTQTSPGDCDLMLQQEAGEPVLVAYSGTLFDQTPRLLDAGQAPLQPVGQAPNVGFRPREKAVVGHAYWLKTRAGGLVRLRVERISRDPDGSPEVKISFFWVKKELSPCCGKR